MADDSAVRVQGLLSDPKVPLDAKQRALTLLPGLDTTVRDRVSALLADPNVGDDVKQRAIALVPQRAKEPAGNLQDFKRDMGAVGKFALEEGVPAAGATAATMLAGPGAGLATRAGLAGGGALVGRVMQRVLSGEQPPAGRETAELLASGAAGEGLASGTLGLMRRVFGVSGHMAAGDVANRAAAERLGIDYLPADVNPGTAGMQGEVGRTATGENVMREGLARRGQQTAAAAERVVLQPMGGRILPSAAGEGITDLAKPALRQLKTQGRGLYQTAEAAARHLHLETPVPATVTTTAAEVLDQLDEGLPAAQAGRARRILEQLVERAEPTPGQVARTVTSPIVGPGGQPLTTTIPGTAPTPPRPMTFDELIAMKRDLNEVLPTYERRGFARDFSTGALERLNGQLDDLIDQTARGTRVEPLWAQARDFWRDEVVPLRKVVEKVAPRTDDEVLDLMVRARRPERLRVLFGQLETTPEGIEAANGLRAAWWTRALDEATNAETGALDPARFMSRWDRLGPEVQPYLIGGRQAEVGELLNVIGGQARGQAIGANPPQTARSLLRAGQTAAALKSGYDALTTSDPRERAHDLLGGAALLGAPYAASRFMTSGPGRQFLTGGLPAVPGGSALVRLLTQALGQGVASSTGAQPRP